jgi:hypothetical protein
MAAPTTTRKLLRQKAIKKLYAHHFPVVSTSTSGGNTTTLVDTVLGPAAQTEDYIGAWVYVSGVSADGTPAVGTIARVTNFTPSTNTLTISPATAADGFDEAGTEYELHYKFHPSQIHEKLNELLENLRRPIYVPLSLFPDGDMELSTTANWDELSSAAVAKDTTNVLRGRRSIEVNSSAANGYVASDPVYLPPGTPVLCVADVYIPSAAGSAILRLWDETNGVEIESGTTVVTGWSRIKFTATTPATCEQVKGRLVAVDAAVNVYFNNAILLPQNQREFSYPSTLEYSEDFDSVFYFPDGDSISASGSDFAYRVLDSAPTKWSNTAIERDDSSVVPFRVVLGDRDITEAIFVGGRVDFATLSDDTTTTTVPEDIMVDLLYASLLDDWAQEALDSDNFNKYNALVGKALSVRKNLLPRMLQFSPNRGQVVGVRRG